MACSNGYYYIFCVAIYLINNKQSYFVLDQGVLTGLQHGQF